MKSYLFCFAFICCLSYQPHSTNKGINDIFDYKFNIDKHRVEFRENGKLKYNTQTPCDYIGQCSFASDALISQGYIWAWGL